MIDFDRDVPKVELAFMNEDHAEATQITNLLLSALATDPPDATKITEIFTRLLQHNREHFAREEEQMQQFDFPPYPVHQREHGIVLTEMAAELDAWTKTADLERLKHYARITLTNWFVNHIATMDTITARYIAGAGGENLIEGDEIIK